MSYFLTTIHFIICFILIALVLLQSGKGSDIAAAFGAGSSQNLFGPRGAATLVSKLTAVFAGLFLLTSLSLVWLSSSPGGSVISKRVVTSPETQQAESQPTVTPEAEKPVAP